MINGASPSAGQTTVPPQSKSSITIDRTPITLHVIFVKTSITPGEILLEEYLRPMGISQNAMARAVGVAPRAINEIVLGKRSITPAMSIHFGAFFGQSETFWHGLQVECDFRALAKERKKLTSGVKPAQELATAH